MKYWLVAAFLIFGDEVISLVVVAVLLYMWLIDIAKKIMEDSE